MKIEYDHSKIEKDVQSKWDESNAFTAKIDNEEPTLRSINFFAFVFGYVWRG